MACWFPDIYSYVVENHCRQYNEAGTADDTAEASICGLELLVYAALSY